MERYVRVQEALAILSKYEDIEPLKRLSAENLQLREREIVDRVRERLTAEASRLIIVLERQGFSKKEIAEAIRVDKSELSRLNIRSDAHLGIPNLNKLVNDLYDYVPKAITDRLVSAFKTRCGCVELMETCFSGMVSEVAKRAIESIVLNNVAAAFSGGALQREILPVPGVLLRIGTSEDGPVIVDRNNSIESRKVFVHELRDFIQREEALIAQMEEENGNRRKITQRSSAY